MTKLKKPVRRETAAFFRNRPIIIQLEYPNIIKLKEKGRRIWYYTTTEALFSMAAKMYAFKKLAAKKEAKRGRAEK